MKYLKLKIEKDMRQGRKHNAAKCQKQPYTLTSVYRYNIIQEYNILYVQCVISLRR